MKEVSHSTPGTRDHRVGVAARRVGSASVGIVVAEVPRDGVDDALRNLGAAGAVEKSRGVTVHSLGERRELGTDVGEVKGGR
jgi:uridine phosphorylase